MNLKHFIDPKDDERIVFALRRHPIIFLEDIAMILVIAIIPLGVFYFLNSQWPDLILGPLTGPTIILIASSYYLMVWLFFIATFIDYYLDLWLVTNYRVVNVEQHSLFSRTISELDLAKVQDITSEIKGVIPSIFNFGDVHIQTAGEKERFIFEQVPHAHDIRKKILDLVQENQRRQMTAVIENIS